MTATEPTTTLPLAPGPWTLDKNHSSVLFVSVTSASPTSAAASTRFEATLDVGADLDSVTVTADVDLSSVDTSNADRDAHLRGTDFFDTDKHPTMTFRSTSVTGSGEDYELVGDLTIAGVTKSVTLDVEFHGTEVFPADQSTHAGSPRPVRSSAATSASTSGSSPAPRS